MSCSAPPGPPPLDERYNGVAPDAQRTENLVTLTNAYWAALAGQRWHQAYRYHTLEFQEKFPFDQWLSRVRGETYDGRRPTVLRWSQAAHRHQGPELYAVLDWVGTPDREGRIVWRQTPRGQFLIERVEPL